MMQCLTLCNAMSVMDFAIDTTGGEAGSLPPRHRSAKHRDHNTHSHPTLGHAVGRWVGGYEYAVGGWVGVNTPWVGGWVGIIRPHGPVANAIPTPINAILTPIPSPGGAIFIFVIAVLTLAWFCLNITAAVLSARFSIDRLHKVCPV